MKNPKSAFFLLFLMLFAGAAIAQPVEQNVKVIIGPDHPNWVYKVGEPVKFNVSVLQYGNPLKNVKVVYELGPEKMSPEKRDSMQLSNGLTTIVAGTMKTPGFYRCVVTAEVNGKKYSSLATVGFDPGQIKPAAVNPDDFVQFWNNAKADLAKIPMDARMTLLPERSTEKVNVYHVNIQNFRLGSRLYGILCVPKKPGKYPALLRVPGAGIRPYNGDVATAEKGVITLEIGIHGVPVTMEPSVYANLGVGALSGYQAFNLEDRDRYYYKRVYMGCVRANDFLTSLPEFDGSTLGVTGGSQGGALSIVTAALDSRVKFLGAYYPALSDLTGFMIGRAGGWPHLFNKDNVNTGSTPDKVKTTGYYDVVNFARLLKVPGMYSWGFNDVTCPPTSMYASYNVITAPKSLFLALETGHWMYPEQRENMDKWLQKQLKVN
ncbi:MAG: acetylxylan esterase [Sphingobacteriales bacterium 17-39-43]|uniref:acetylxylan esterase n=1 Tax=Daejeonella sp. TaxID=2805397 RepID=UPI000BDCA9E8|nr:acetylxylan esterase [Daejeonella sp.]OYZ30931.1 MAG: acetylxylan esterase [Sphingobacteriales bacterium 16-39-50]OZA23842.1 MAG: acetylxylan esterase [Sphingobacteriales bacterium 17-39-43]OZA59985.1 MAG: acetylxylan esterase [Sphingobacteriales bacterium 39-40-5]HQS51513.1 acetylxylan esterase [Daejeonella sp.]HQT22818.1 acetylxylan esterase [Daejeonella sp.]